MTLEELIGDGWKRHDGQAQEVAAELADARELLVAPSQLPAYTRLLTHLYAEHLDDPTIGVRLLLPLRDRFESAATTSYRPICTAMATLRFLAHDPPALNGLSHEERASALATAASAIAARGDVAAGVAAITSALELAAASIPDASPALRALAVGASNIAVELERKTDRGRDDDRAMVRIADAALAWWRRAGGWLEEERAHYRCARSHLAAGTATDAIRSADACVRLCEANDAPAFERFFAHAVRAMAYRADAQMAGFERDRSLARVAHEALATDSKMHCTQQLGELEANA